METKYTLLGCTTEIPLNGWYALPKAGTYSGNICILPEGEDGRGRLFIDLKGYPVTIVDTFHLQTRMDLREMKMISGGFLSIPIKSTNVYADYILINPWQEGNIQTDKNGSYYDYAIVRKNIAICRIHNSVKKTYYWDIFSLDQEDSEEYIKPEIIAKEVDDVSFSGGGFTSFIKFGPEWRILHNIEYCRVYVAKGNKAYELDVITSELNPTSMSEMKAEHNKSLKDLECELY